MPRLARLDAPGVLHHIMIRGIELRRIFRNDKDREDFLVRLGKIVKETATPCLCWALTPNHIHFFVNIAPVKAGVTLWMSRRIFLASKIASPPQRKYLCPCLFLYHPGIRAVCREEALHSKMCFHSKASGCIVWIADAGILHAGILWLTHNDSSPILLATKSEFLSITFQYFHPQKGQ